MSRAVIMIRVLIAVTGALVLGLVGRHSVLAATQVRDSESGRACTALAGLTFEGHTTITDATVVSSGHLDTPRGDSLSDLPVFCRAVGVSRPTEESAINFEIWLPSDESWNGRFVSSGEGGFAGRLNYTRDGLDGGLDEWLRRGYATASTDTGHVAMDDDWAIDHPERVVDYAYRAKHLVTVTAKGVVAAHYGRPPDYSYFNSCSNGGRQALQEVQRYPDDYDGVVVGAPWNYQSHSNAGFVWDAQTLDRPGAAIPVSKLPAIHAAVMAACDAADGLEDKLITDPSRCEFHPSDLACPEGEDGSICLTPPQVEALKRFYDGPTHPRTGASIFPGWAKGGELGWADSVVVANVRNLGDTYFSGLVFQDPDWDYRTFDFDRDLASAEDTVGALADAIETDLSAARERGVKIIQYHGWNDAVLQPAYSPEYYEHVAEAMGGLEETQDFYRLFMAPGMAHCYRGPGANSFGGVGQQIPPTRDARHDVQLALEAWVEDDTPPAYLIATKYVDDDPETTTVAFTRKLCPHPQVSRYDPGGDPNDAESFTCVVP